ncbi:MAG: dimethylmenaquinone methyltransferase [Actinobacteria bacterium]|nr:dimethylmenaquinone methyltransferase [Actinomycetota bacterium]
MITLFSTPEVLEVAGGGARFVAGLTPIAVTAALCGPAATCACAPGDNLAIHRLLEQAPAGSVLVVDAGGRTDCGHFGELAGMDAENREIQGLVIAGAVRDGGALAVLGFPVFHGGFAPVSCVKERVGSVNEPVTIAGVEIAPGDQVIADSDAILVVAAADWPAVAVDAQAIRDSENALRTKLLQGERLSEFLDLPE